MSLAKTRDIGSYITTRCSDLASLTTSTDGSEIDGAFVDRTGFLSAKLVLAYEAALGDGKTLTIAANLQDDSSSGGSGTDYGTAYSATVVSTGGTGGTTNRGVVELDFDLSGAKQYIRPQYTPTLSATSADTVIIGAVLVLGGGPVLPAA